MDWVLSPIHYMIISKLKFCSELCYLRPILTTFGLFWRIISNSYRYCYLFSPMEKGSLWMCGHPTLFSKYWDFFLLSAVILLLTFVGNAYSVFSSLPSLKCVWLELGTTVNFYGEYPLVGPKHKMVVSILFMSQLLDKVLWPLWTLHFLHNWKSCPTSIIEL